MLTAAIDVWAGNSALNSEALWNVDLQPGYVKIGESNQANGQIVFNGTGSYDYIVIATRARVNVDAVKGSDDQYLTPMNNGGTDNVSAVSGAEDGQMALVRVSPDEFSSGPARVTTPSTAVLAMIRLPPPVLHW